SFRGMVGNRHPFFFDTISALRNGPTRTKDNRMIIEVKNVTRSFRSAKKKEGLKAAIGLLLNPEYQTHQALKGVSFSIEAGSFNGLIGANGAGKTTLLKILSGLIAPTSGEASVLGYEPFKRSLDFRRK